jgi:hypothetical protein
MNEVLDLCPKCNAEGDPIQAVDCVPCKWQCPDCNAKWTKDGLCIDSFDTKPFQISGY